jgi:4-amino-4-deoxy-L-arabinose transferase-like glycosyltransferase
MKTPEWFVPLMAGALLALMGLLAGGAAMRESVTYDEVAHIGAGVSYWQKLDLRLNEEHPPLPKVLAAFPLFLRGARADYSHVAWTMSDRLFPAYVGQLYFGELVLKHWNDPRNTLALARLPMLLLTLLLGCLVFFYARAIGGGWGGLLSTAVYASTPLFLGYGPLVHTDVTAAAFAVLTLFAAASLWRTPSRTGSFVFGLSLAGALLSKFSAPILLLALAAFVLTLWLRPLGGPVLGEPEAQSLRARRLRAALAGMACSVAAVYAFYSVFSWNQPSSILCDIGSRHGATILRRALMPPWLYLRGMFLVALSSSRSTYLLGHSYPQGVWFYFPFLLCLKSPLGFLGLLVLGAGAAAARRVSGKPGVSVIPESGAAHWRVLWVSTVVFSAVCMASNLNIGFRHFSVPLELLILMLAPLPRMAGHLRHSVPKTARLLTVLIAACAAQCLVTALAAYPFYLPYANAFGSSRPAYELFNDSNLDWDQALPEVERFVERHGIRTIRLDHYGYTDAAVTVPNARIWNCESPAAADGGQWAAVSANLIADARHCQWLMQYPHEALGGGSMYAVRLPAIVPPVGSAGGPPSQELRSGFMGTAEGGDARQLFLDFVRDPSVVRRSGDDAEHGLTQWTGRFLQDRPWFKRRVLRWLHDGARQ